MKNGSKHGKLDNNKLTAWHDYTYTKANIY